MNIQPLLSRLFRSFAVLLLMAVFCLSASRSQARDTVTIGLLPEMNVFAQMQRYQPLADYLSRELDIDLQLTMLSRYGNIIERLSQNKVDGAFLGSFTAALAIAQLGIEPLARPVNLDGTSTYHGHIFVRKDSSIRTAEDMRGKTMAFVEQATTAGYVFPLAWLKRNGINDDFDTFFKDYYFAGSHDATIDAVLKGQADIGAAKNTIYDFYLSRNPEAAKKLLIIASSPPVPSNGLCLLPGASNKLKSGLQKTLLSLHTTAAGREVLRELRMVKFVKTVGDDYLPVMKMARDAGIALKTYRYENN